jgi:hypothetical protein
MASSAQSSAADTASGASLQGTRESIASQEKMFETIQEQQRPWREVGEKALGEMWGVIEDPESFKASPYYDFVRSEGEKAIIRNAAATGGRGGGALNKDLMKYGQNTAAMQYDNYLNNLSVLAGMGQGSTNVVSNAGMNTGNAIANTQMQSGANLANIAMNKGNAQASGYINAANTTNNLLGNLTTAYLLGKN